MYQIVYYKDKNGNCPIAEYLHQLASKGDKDSRIKLNKIYEYVKYLSETGQHGREPYVKHLGDGLWELRPLRDRILFAAWDGKRFILLHHFVKKTRKTPSNEIAQAKRNLNDIKKRGLSDE